MCSYCFKYSNSSSQAHAVAGYKQLLLRRQRHPVQLSDRHCPSRPDRKCNKPAADSACRPETGRPGPTAGRSPARSLAPRSKVAALTAGNDGARNCTSVGEFRMSLRGSDDPVTELARDGGEGGAAKRLRKSRFQLHATLNENRRITLRFTCWLRNFEKKILPFSVEDR